MRLIFLYGAPAVGKRTIGGELATLTGWKLHHDHMVVDLAVALFAFDDPRFIALRHRLHLDTLEAAVAGGLPGLVFAYCVGGAWDDSFLAEVIDRYGAGVSFVHLRCDVEENQRRVAGSDRGRFNKITEVKSWLETVQTIDFSREVVHSRHFDLDTTRLTAAESARSIAVYFNLTTAPSRTDGG